MSSSQSRIDANRENAKLSTGPKTEEGKKVSCLNALRHGLNSAVDVLPGEDMKAFMGLTNEFEETWQPKNSYELRLVRKMASLEWRLQRCGSLENAMFALGHDEFGETVDPDHAQIHAALTAARSFMANPRALESLSRHESRIHRLAEGARKELQQVQAMRQQRERADLVRVAELYKTAKMKGLPYHPEDDGFVLNIAQIEDHIARDERRIEAQIAGRCHFNHEKFRATLAA